MQIYRDHDADLSLLQDRQIAVIGYGNQGRAQALNLRDNGLAVIIGNQEDSYAATARMDGFSVLPITEAARQGDILLILIPDEIMPAVYDREVAPYLEDSKALVFASGYNLAFGNIHPLASIDVVLVAPRMIGVGVRELFQSGSGFPAFFSIANDASGKARALALALAKGIGATRAGVVEVTVAQEAELDLFTEQCFGPAFGQVLISAVNLLLDEGYPPEAVLLELYMSGEFSYTLAKIAELGMIEQTRLHSRTSQYGSISRGLRFMLPELRERMAKGLEEIRSGAFAQEWAAEQASGCATLESLQETARALPLYQLESELRTALGDFSSPVRVPPRGNKPDVPHKSTPVGEQKPPGWLKRLVKRATPQEIDNKLTSLETDELVEVLEAFIAGASKDSALQEFAQGRQLSSAYSLKDVGISFYLNFSAGAVSGGMGEPAMPADVRLETSAEILDGMFSGRIDGTRAALTGKVSFSGDTRLAMGMQRIQGDLRRLYQVARTNILTNRLRRHE